MATYFDRMYWKECWPAALRDVLRDFMAAGDASGVSGLLCLSVCHRGTATHAYECAIAALVRQILDGFVEAEGIKQRLVKEELQLKAEGVYESQKKIAELKSRGLVPLVRLHYEVEGYRRSAREIYTSLKEAGFLVVEEHAVGRRKSEWVGLNANWNGLIGDIRESGASKNMWASSAGVMLSMAVTERGITTVQPMYVGILAAANQDGKMGYRELLQRAYANVHQGKKALDIILERQREKTDALKIWPHDDGQRLIVNPNAVYAVKAWRDQTNNVARRRGLGI